MNDKRRQLIIILIFVCVAVYLNINADRIFKARMNAQVDKIVSDLYEKGMDGADVWEIRNSLLDLQEGASSNVKINSNILIFLLVVISPLLLIDGKKKNKKE